MSAGQVGLRIAVSNVKAPKSAVAELILQHLGTYGSIADSSGARGPADLHVTTGAEFAGGTVDHQDVLILDATEANKKALLSTVGFHTSGDAWAYFVGEVAPGHYRVIELAKDESVGVHEATITPRDKGQPLAADLTRGATKSTLTRDRPDLAAERLASSILDYRVDAKAGGLPREMLK
jgi:hypothetical protein